MALESGPIRGTALVSSSTSDPPARPTARRGARLLAAGAVVLGLLAFGSWYTQVGRGLQRHEARAAIAWGEDYLKVGRPGLAIAAVADIPEDQPEGARALAIRGLALALLDRPEEARGVLERSWQLDPTWSMVPKVLAAIYFSRSEVQRGLAMLEAAARLDPGDFRPWYGAGDMYRRLNRADDAARAFGQALRLQPDHHESRLGRIWALLETRPPEEVTPLLQQALVDRPSDPEVLTLAARQALALGDQQGALQYVERCLALDPDRAEALRIRAGLRRAAGQLQPALEDAERAVTLAPHDPTALYQLALVEAALGLADRAAATSERHQVLKEQLEQMRQLEQQIELRPTDPQPHWQLGQIAAEAGMTDFAARHFRAALALDLACQPARRGLAALGLPAPGPAAP